MMPYRPYDGLPHTDLHVSMMTKKSAEAFERRVHNIPPEVRLGYPPYTIIVQGFGGSPYTAFRNLTAFKRWLGACEVKLNRRWKGDSGVRSGRIKCPGE